jgi:hypothetical protein
MVLRIRQAVERTLIVHSRLLESGSYQETHGMGHSSLCSLTDKQHDIQGKTKKKEKTAKACQRKRPYVKVLVSKRESVHT